MAFKGQIVELPIGEEGLTGSADVSSVPPGYLLEAENLSFNRGLLQKEGGATKYNSTVITGAPVVLGGWDHRTNALAQRMIVATSAGTLLKDSGSGTFATTLASGLSFTMRPFFVGGGKEAAAGNRKLFVFTGTNVVQVLADDGATTAALATPPADWSGTNQPTFGFIYKSRLMAAGNANDPHRLYYSTISNHEDFTGAGSGTLAIFPGEGEALTGGIVFSDYAILFKRPLGVYKVDMRDPTIANWKVEKLSSAVGLASPWAIVPIDNDILYIDSTGGIQSVEQSLSNMDVESRNLGQTSEFEPLFRSLVNPAALDQVRGVYYVAKREVHFAYPAGSSTINNSRLVLDLYRPDKIRFRNSTRDTCTALWLRRDANGVQRVLFGDDLGFVWQLDQSTYNKDGAAYLGRAVTVPTDLGYANPEYKGRRKNAAFLELVFEPLNTNSVTVTLTWDTLRTETIVFSPQARGAALGAFVLGTDQLGGATLSRLTRRVTGGGKYLSLTFQNNVVNEVFAIAKAYLYFTLGSN